MTDDTLQTSPGDSNPKDPKLDEPLRREREAKTREEARANEPRSARPSMLEKSPLQWKVILVFGALSALFYGIFVLLAFVFHGRAVVSVRGPVSY